MISLSDTDIADILKKYRTIAVVGLSPKPARPSNEVAGYMIEAGYTIIPVNPGQTEILGRKCYPDLISIPDSVDVVNIFRRSEDIMPIVDDAVRINASVVWMQLGIVNEEAAARARSSGLTVIMDRCIKVDHENLVTIQQHSIGRQSGRPAY
ncbi:MAG: CoA-binding protein [Desulfobulbaceae bacterium]|nr:CoA-binding protein [Desulfobulbaceae bacterium]